MPKDKLSAASKAARAMVAARWAKPDADRNQPREAGKLGGRPLSADRCACRLYTKRTAALRKHVC